MEVRLDVSMLEPCEPLERTLEAIQQLERGSYLRVIHRREPRLLYPQLKTAGFCWQTLHGGPADFTIFVWRDGDAGAAASVQRAVEKLH